MSEQRPPLSERQVGAAIRLLSDEHAARVAGRDAERAWRRIEAGVTPAGALPAGGFGRRFAGLAAVAGLVAAAALWLGFRADSSLSYELSGAMDRDGVIEAERGEATVSLSDGSSILAENRTKFSIDVIGRSSALTRLVSGKLHVRVQHEADTSYRFIAGPYEIRVVGTEFHLGWEPSDGLRLSMLKGQVQLVGPDRELRTLGAGESLSLPGVAPVAQELAALPGSAPPPGGEPAAGEPVAAARAPRATPKEAAAAPSWDGLVAKGQFAQVVSEAEGLGVDAVLASRGPSDLRALGQAARYVGKRALSVRAFGTLRERHRGSDAAKNAAFFLARLHEEQGNQAEALRWLERYVAEAPRGVYAAEAYGRRLSLTERVRGRAAALPLAREYLERFPEGAYARSARGIAQGP